MTGGGDTPSLNSTLYAIVKAAEDQDGEVLCFRRGWAGGLYPDKEYYVKVEKNGKLRLEKLRESTGEYVFLNSKDINPDQGGSIILSSRTNLEAIEGALEDFSRRLKELRIDYFLPIGGDDTTTVTSRIIREKILDNIPVMTVPKTIDNDNGKIGHDGKFNGLEAMINIWTPGFPTAVRNGRTFCDDTYTTAYTHEMVMWVETMGRNAGWLALAIGELAKAPMTIIPECSDKIEEVCRKALETYKQHGYFYGVIAQGAINAETGMLIAEDKSLRDSFGNAKLGGAANVMAGIVKEYFKKNDVYSPYFDWQVPGRMLRGGSPNRLDHESALKLGRHALLSVINDSKVNGYMAVLLWNGKKALPGHLPLEKAVCIDENGRIIPRQVPIDLETPANGFYDPGTGKATELGRKYSEVLGVQKIKFAPWVGEVYK